MRDWKDTAIRWWIDNWDAVLTITMAFSFVCLVIAGDGMAIAAAVMFLVGYHHWTHR